ncbi:MAG TPA: XshC-Cox1 family protein, partial [Acidimicrobiaceae bacterium]|nr:XshC-Cox1 family protein [Acidimicrobiaceae bacterium]
HYGERGEARENAVSVFIESFAAPPRMLVFGAVDFTAALVRVAKVLGYRITVCDAR